MTQWDDITKNLKPVTSKQINEEIWNHIVVSAWLAIAGLGMLILANIMK